MRHYLWYNADGQICGMSRNIYGWDPATDPTDPDTTDPMALQLRQHFLTGPTDGGPVDVIAFDCPCPLMEESCLHDCEALENNYVDTGALVSKPSIVLKLDDVEVASSSTPIDYPPGTSINFKIEAAVPDGHQTTLIQEEASIIGGSPVLTFTSGVSNTIVLTAPAQGLMGRIACYDKYLLPRLIVIRGWA